jgi:hypothetical protein
MARRHGFGFKGVLVNSDGATWHQAANITPRRVSASCNVLQVVTASFMQPMNAASH